MSFFDEIYLLDYSRCSELDSECPTARYGLRFSRRQTGLSGLWGGGSSSAIERLSDAPSLPELR